MGEHGVYQIHAGLNQLEVELLAFVWEPDFTVERVASILELIRRMAQVLEVGGDQVCVYCAKRFVPERSRTCPNCGARMDG